ncbi:MAG: glycosyltransferase [bacterium]|nr:glycosyltransferase [bacterium]
MKIALAHDYLNQCGGAENVLKVLAEIFPEAPIYTLFYDENKTRSYFKNRVKKTSFLDFGIVRNHHRAFIPLLPLASSNLKIEPEYDLVISSSAGYAKGFNSKNAFHICYCHTPLRYAWEENYLQGLDLFHIPLLKTLAKPVRAALRSWDKKASRRVDVFIANSYFIAQKIKNFYNREAEVIYPPIDLKKFYPEPSQKTGDYFLMVGRLLHYKRFDLGIEAFNQLGLPLKIVGEGPELQKLKSMVKSPLIEFCSYIENLDELRKIYSGAKALIFPQIEDFGMVAAEAQACGLPVIGYNTGGVKEIIKEGRTGLLFNEQTPEALIKAVYLFEKTDFSKSEIIENAQRFSKENFKSKFQEIINKIKNEENKINHLLL